MPEPDRRDRPPLTRAQALRDVTFDVGWVLGNLAAWTVMGLLAGLPALTVESQLRTFIALAADAIAESSLGSFDATARVGLSVTLALTTMTLTPLLWRVVSQPLILRALLAATVQLLAVSAALLFPAPGVGSVVALTLAGTGSIGWILWSKKWRGAGVAPSPLAGVLRPEIRPGQIWFAVVVGTATTKVRPVIVLGRPEGSSRWTVAYLTTQEPRPHLAEHYIEVPPGDLRGLPKGNWVSLRDPRTLPRPKFRSYNGLAPAWLYEAVCSAVGVDASSAALTIPEAHAGEQAGPVERFLRRGLMLGSAESRDVLAAMNENLRALLTQDVFGDRPGRATPARRAGQRRP